MSLITLIIIIVIIVIWYYLVKALKPKNHNQQKMINRYGGGPRRWKFNNYSVLIADDGHCYATYYDYSVGFRKYKLTDHGHQQLIKLIHQEFPMSIIKGKSVWLSNDHIKDLMYDINDLDKMLFG